MLSEQLQNIYDNENIHIRKIHFVDDCVKAIIINNTVFQSDGIEDAYEDNVVKAHELAHHRTNPPNLFQADKITQAKYERIAIRDTAKMLCPLEKLIQLYFRHIRTVEDIADELEVTPKYICSVLEYYAKEYGNPCRYKNYRICFMPLEIKDEKTQGWILSGQ